MKKMLIQSLILVVTDCTSVVVCGWKRIKVQSDDEKKVLRNLYEEGTFSIIVILEKNVGCN